MKLSYTTWSRNVSRSRQSVSVLPGTSRSILPGTSNGAIAQEIVAPILCNHEERLLPHDRPDMHQIPTVQKQVTTLPSLPDAGKLCVVEEDFRRTRGIRSILKVVVPSIQQQHCAVGIKENR